MTRAICGHCSGRGLLGNEQEICRLCNGTGNLDGFSEIPRAELRPGTTFIRKCDKCGSEVFEIGGEIETIKVQKSWGLEVELREYETRAQVKIRCLQCANSYTVPVNSAVHDKVSAEREHCAPYVRLDGAFRCANIKCEYYCPEGHCALSDREQA